MDLIENKLIAKINWFETAQVNVRSGGLEFAAFWRIPGFENSIYNYLEENARLSKWKNPDGSTGEYVKDQNVSDVNDYVAEGMEIELIYNPTSNWRIAFNATKQETIQSNSGIAIQEYIAQRKPFWDKFANEPFSNTETFQQRFDSNVGIQINNEIAQDGRISVAQSKWSWNAITNYSFREGKLNGLALGGSARWRQGDALGYPIINDPSAGLISDVDNPFFGPSELNIGVHASYRKKIMNDPLTGKSSSTSKTCGEITNWFPTALTQMDLWLPPALVASPSINCRIHLSSSSSPVCNLTVVC